MANDLSTLNGYLDVALRDTTDQTWTSAEKDNLIRWAISRLQGRIGWRNTYVQAVSPTVSWYSLAASGLESVDRVDLYNGAPFGTGKMVMPLPAGTWEVVGDFHADQSPQLYVNPSYTTAGYYFLIHGQAKFDTATALIPDMYVPAVIAVARAEAYRRMGADRAQFKAWLSKNQVQNISVNELILLINEADAEAQLQLSRLPIKGKPVPGRV